MAHLLLPAATTVLAFLLCLSSPTTATEVVHDIQGNPLEAGSAYYVRTALWGAGGRGGLVMASKSNTGICPQYAAQLSKELQRGSPIMFYPSDSSQKHIHLSSDLNIVLGGATFCFNGIWKMTADANSGTLYVTSGGKIGSASDPDTLPNWFKIEKAEISYTYKITYCPSTVATSNVSPKSEIVCGAIDSIESQPDLGLSYLGLASSLKPSVFMQILFEKA